MNIVKFLAIPILKNICKRLFLTLVYLQTFCYQASAKD